MYMRMYTRCWQYMGDVYSVGSLWGDVHRVLALSGGCTQGVGSLWEMYTVLGGLGMCIGCWRSMGMYPGCWLSLGGCTQGVGSL